MYTSLSKKANGSRNNNIACRDMNSREYQHLYNTTRWRRRRKAQLGAEPLCRYCASLGYITAARVADHIEPHKGDELLFFEGELQSLCTHCHNSVKAEKERGGLMRGGDANGMPLDPDHHWNKKN